MDHAKGGGIGWEPLPATAQYYSDGDEIDPSQLTGILFIETEMVQESKMYQHYA